MGVQLYTVRVVLSVLGSTDYGLNNVVGGIVTMFSFLSGTMATASQRYFAFEIGRGDMPQLKKTFSLTLIIYCMLAVVILILAETIGIWFLNNRMIIPPDRIVAANWVFQFAVFSFMLTMFQVPYDALVIAREKMNIYAYVSILEVILKLVIVYLLSISSFDKLITYSFLGFCVTLIITSIYKSYCIRNYTESHFKYYWNKKMFKEITSYSGWNLFGALAGVANNQGINILINLFFGPAVNAARAIAYQINSSVNGFVQNFMTATKPQITKLYAQGNIQDLNILIERTSKFSFILLLIIVLPLGVESSFILRIWLKNIPDYTIAFVQLIFINTLIDTISYALMAGAQATGKIKNYQAVVGTIMLLNLPISYFVLKIGVEPQQILVVNIIISVVCLFARLFFLNSLIRLNIVEFFKNVIIRVILVSIGAYYLILQIKDYFAGDSFGNFILICIASFVLITVLSYIVVLKGTERTMIFAFIKGKIKKK
jgi:Na+-driven multidrug efflux pump